MPGSSLAFSGHNALSFLSVANHSSLRSFHPTPQRPVYCLLFLRYSVGFGEFGGMQNLQAMPQFPFYPGSPTRTLIVTLILCSFPAVKHNRRINCPGSPFGTLISFILPRLTSLAFDTGQKEWHFLLCSLALSDK